MLTRKQELKVIIYEIRSDILILAEAIAKPASVNEVRNIDPLGAKVKDLEQYIEEYNKL